MIILLMNDLTSSPEAVPRIKPIAIPIKPWSFMNFLKPANCTFGSTAFSFKADFFVDLFCFLVII